MVPDVPLWLALHLPALPLQVLTRLLADPRPCAVTEGVVVLHANDSARAAGVADGMRLAAAQARAPTLLAHPRDPHLETRALSGLAAWALQYTSRVSLHPPQGLLLEIGGSLRLFGGLPALLTLVREGLDQLGYQGQIGVAPTPAAAEWLALAGDTEPVVARAELEARLAPLPIARLPFAPAEISALAGLGLRTLGECLRLPRAGLARRLGPAWWRRLDQALGRLPDPRVPYLPPPQFHAQLELPAEVEHIPPLLFVCNRLVNELCGFLRGLDSGAQRLEFSLRHAQVPATVVTLSLVEPSRDAAYLLPLLRERLERVALPAPVRALALRVTQFERIVPVRGELLGDPGRPPHAWTHLIERLGARLGEEVTQGLACWDDHRPERAWRYTPPGQELPTETVGERPLWLLSQPVSLRLKANQPCWHGPLILEQGPERIETGWWDDEDIRRDYYIARNAEGARLWVFREPRSGSWFLHGLFG